MHNVLTRRLANQLQKWGLKKIAHRDPDFTIGELDDPYLLRWYIIPRNRFFNIYLHYFLKSDDDRAMHDHPWWSISLALSNKGALEKYYVEDWAREEHVRPVNFGDLIVRSAKFTHRIELRDRYLLYNRKLMRKDIAYYPFMTLFITGPKIREWGFWCENGYRFVPWETFCKPGNPGERGQGCD